MDRHPGKSDLATSVAAIVADLKHLEGPLLPILHAVQEVFGYVPEEAVPIIAADLNLSRAEVHGVVTFYHDYRHQPAGRHVLKLCRAEACQAMGADRLAEQVKIHLGIDFHETSADGAVTLEPVFCLGLCSTAPAAMLDGGVHGRLDASALDSLLAEVVA
ncbi:formate dehydrogenase [Rhizobium sp. Leaf384]|uniref:formate dehydrogenase subunit gamma n=1 Tax=unclassified Rhizobium TaxID=2613769 RepID=UPI000714A323|nr:MULTISPECIES: formate dehydrogenase subunit gamma [unclassified Rhizobium]KQS76296.1 formate dehydrogenase [Rhizobium sp. Leaf384]KQS78435.1 formate dehydrogenase [Rhizobium sp. Leaf383]